MQKLPSIALCLLLLLSGIPMTGVMGSDENEYREKRDILANDVLYSPFDSQLRGRAGPPGISDTSEYLMGSIALGVILLESNGSLDPNLENWTTTEITKVRSEINESLAWWAAENINANISSVTDYHLCPTSYEPIIHPSASDPTYQELWATEAMADLGYTQGNYWQRIRDYINDIREQYHTDWTYMVFVIDSSLDEDGLFSDGYCAYGYLGGPFLVMTYDNGVYGVEDMMQVCRHESAHIFYATDEYNGVTEYSGYLNASDIEGADCIMYFPGSGNVCSGTRLQLGWRDTDEDGILDIMDTEPETILNDPTGTSTLTYTGSATDVAYPNENPGGPGNDITINTINMVYYRLDDGSYLPATPSDGTWDSWEEHFTFTVTVPPGSHTIEAAAVNSVGNMDQTPANDTVLIGNPPNPPTITGPTTGRPRIEYSYNVSAQDSDGPCNFLVDWGDGTNTSWLDLAQSVTVKHTWSIKGAYSVKAKAKDIFGMESDWGYLPVSIPTNLPLNQESRPINHHPLLNLILQLLKQWQATK
jgi:hypothetical protein